MKDKILATDSAVVLVGGGYVNRKGLARDLAREGYVVAADGGAEAILALDALPDWVIGDLDSLSQKARSQIPCDRIHHISEQDSTDFDKVLRHISAPLFLAHGFLGQRIDHSLAALNVLVRNPHKRCILLAENDVVMLCPPDLRLELPDRCRVSLFPFRSVSGTSTGLKWPISGLEFAPWGQSGTSNHSVGPVHLQFNEPGMVLILPLDQLDAVLRGLVDAPTWPAP